MIAIAISAGPSLLIADEPTTALDVTVQKTILLLIKDILHEFQMGVIFISHDLGVVAEIADSVIVMYKGNMVEAGSVQDILQSPKHPYTKALLACRPLLHSKGERLPVVSDFMEVSGTGEIIAKPGAWLVKSQTVLPSENTIPASAPLQQSELVRVENLKVWYPAKKALFRKPQAYIKAVDNVSFSVFEGETLGWLANRDAAKLPSGGHC
jgi:peptide/nickel transport system ATP-binding protein